MNGLGREFLDRIGVHDHVNAHTGAVITLALNWTSLIALAIFSEFKVVRNLQIAGSENKPQGGILNNKSSWHILTMSYLGKDKATF